MSAIVLQPISSSLAVDHFLELDVNRGNKSCIIRVLFWFNDGNRLPRILVDATKHFVHECEYQSEFEKLIRGQGGAVPGSPNVDQLLGRSVDGWLVFENLSPSACSLGRFSSLAGQALDCATH
ncbi:hypothetical protein V8C26DRAFT_428129 [Trichoderma gracile]